MPFQSGTTLLESAPMALLSLEEGQAHDTSAAFQSEGSTAPTADEEYVQLALLPDQQPPRSVKACSLAPGSGDPRNALLPSRDSGRGKSRASLIQKVRADTSSGTRFVEGLAKLHLAGVFPTLAVDLLCGVPIIFASVFVVMTDGFELRQSFSPRWTFEPTDYWQEIKRDSGSMAAFCMYAFDVLLSFAWVLYHLCSRHHPKHHSSKGNVISIAAHIVGGTVAIFGFFFGLVSGSKWPTFVACLGSLLLHTPSTWWQLRNVYGHRDVTIPGYSFTAWALLMAVLNVIWEDASFRTVVAAGMTLHIFSWVRLLIHLMRLEGLTAHQLYDRGVLLAGLIHSPWCWGGFFGPLVLCGYILLWNLVFNMVKPFPRELLSHNFQFFPFPQTSASGESTHDVLQRMSQTFEGDRNRQAAAAVYELIKSGEYLVAKDLQLLFASWGMVNSVAFAEKCFEDADPERTGVITLDSFQEYFDFVYLPVLHEAFVPEKEGQ